MQVTYDSAADLAEARRSTGAADGKHEEQLGHSDPDRRDQLRHTLPIRRVDGPADVAALAGDPAVHYPSDYREFDGIMVPTRRRVYVRNPDGTPAQDTIPISVDLTDVTFS